MIERSLTMANGKLARRRESIPIMVSSGSWCDVLPEWLVKKIFSDRGRQTEEEFLREATDSEVLAYLHTLSLEGMLDRDYADVMFYTLYRVLKDLGRECEIPEDIRVDSLSGDTLRIYEELKRKLRSASLRSRSKLREREL